MIAKRGAFSGTGLTPGAKTTLEEQGYAFLQLKILILHDDAGNIADEVGRKLLCQFAASALANKLAVSRPANGVQTEFQDRNFQAQKEPAVQCLRIVDAVAIADSHFTDRYRTKRRIGKKR